MSTPMHIPRIMPLRSQFADDPEMGELLVLFLSELESKVNAMRTSVESGDVDTLTRVTHQVRGAAGGYGYPQITNIAAQVEETLRGGGSCEQVESTVYDLLGLCLAAIEGGAY